MLFAEPVPEHRHGEQSAFTFISNITQQFHFDFISVHCGFDGTCPYLIGEENINWDEKQANANNSSSCSFA